jgi:hypothetical protein
MSFLATNGRDDDEQEATTMTDLSARIPESAITALARRTTRLIEMVERATQVSPEKGIREGGAQLAELLSERLEEIRELHAMEDDDLPDRIRAFSLRIKMAEAKVMTWKMPKPLKTAVAKAGARPNRKREKSAA